MIKVTIGNNITRKPYLLDESTTLRQALEQAEIDYSVGMTSLDGSTLQPGQMDKTFAELLEPGADHCFLLNVVKAQNAASIKILGNNAVVVSGAKLDTIKTLVKHRPKALVLYEGTGSEKEEVFKVSVGGGDGSINKYGATFGATPDDAGNALISLRIPDGTTDAKKWAMDKIGTAILNLNKVEAKFAEAKAEVDTELAAIQENIQVL